MKKITLTKRVDDWHACLSDDPTIWGAGPNPYEAVGSLILSHKEAFEVEVARNKDLFPPSKARTASSSP